MNELNETPKEILHINDLSKKYPGAIEKSLGIEPCEQSAEFKNKLEDLFQKAPEETKSIESDSPLKKMFDELVNLSSQARAAQKEYFRTRDKGWLITSKQREKKLDDFLSEVNQ